MYKRKKFHGGLKVLLSLLFIMLLGTCSTCYAIETGEMNTTQGEYIFDYFFNRDMGTYTNFSFQARGTPTNRYWYTTQTRSAMKNAFFKQENIDYFVEQFNIMDKQTNDIGVEHYVFVPISQSLTTCSIVCIPINNSIGNSVPHLKIGPYSRYYDSYKGGAYFTEVVFQTTENTNFDTFYITVSATDNSTVSNANLGKQNTLYFIFNSSSGTEIFKSWNQSTTTYEAIRNICSINNAYFFGNSNINTESTNLNNYTQAYILKSFYEPPQPTPTPTLPPSGTITNPSGEVTGNIDLSGIENGIKDIKDTISGEGQAIRDTISGESEKIINSIENANQNYWGSGESLTGEEQEQQIEENINKLMEDVSGELTNSEIMQQLERSRSRLLRLFQK